MNSDTATTARPDDPLLGVVLDGRYRIDALLGEGGMGVVYRARQLALGRDVAVKVVSAPARLDDVAVARLMREGRLAGAITHPGVVTLLDQGRTADGLPYLVMELVPGRSLKDVLRAGALPVAVSLGIARQLADALAAVHALGVVHRDLKPGNVMVLDGAGDARVKVLDFGLAKGPAGSDERALTRTDAIVGTPLYMAPEVLFGDAPDARADVYALGVVLYEMLAGRPPHVAPTPMALMARVASAPPDPLPPGVPGVVVGVVERLTSRRPDERCASAAQARDLLDAVIERLRGGAIDPLAATMMVPPEVAVVAPPAAPPSASLSTKLPPSSWWRRRDVRVVAVLLLALSASGGVAFAFFSRPGDDTGAFDGRYQGRFWADMPPCSAGVVEMRVERGALTGTAAGAITVGLRGAVDARGDGAGDFLEGDTSVGRFEGRFDSAGARGRLRDEARGCTGAWEVVRAE